MVETLVLVRHGDAELFGPEGTDESRRLTELGIEALERDYPMTFARICDRADLKIWVSPAVRALETAEIAGKVLDIEPESFELHNSLYEQDDDVFVAELEAEGTGCIVAVGHIPFMQRLAFELAGVDLPFGKGAVAAISFPTGDLRRGQLDWFVQGPKL